MRDADKVLGSGEEITDEQMAERRARAMEEYDDDSSTVNLLGCGERIMLIEEEMRGCDIDFSRLGSVFDRGSFLPLEEFIVVTDRRLTRDQQYEKVRAFRAARDLRREQR
ncbi:hypothetical protein CF326_g8240 [Tilletia indica]|nr:hypothetical protein CF326_g8240 [Tilletia indica]